MGRARALDVDSSRIINVAFRAKVAYTNFIVVIVLSYVAVIVKLLVSPGSQLLITDLSLFWASTVIIRVTQGSSQHSLDLLQKVYQGLFHSDVYSSVGLSGSVTILNIIK